MSKGKARTILLDHSASLVEGSAAGSSWGFLYQHSTVKHPGYNIGDRVALADGRVFRYAYADTARTTGYGMMFNALVAQGYTVLAAAQEIGDMSVTVVSAVDLAEDELRGGYIVMYTGDPNNTFRGIVGNSAVSATETVTIYLDAPLHIAVTITTGSEFFYNPYAHVAELAEDWLSVAGVSVTDIATAGYCWIQTWGLIRISLHAKFGDDAGERQVVFGPNGDLRAHSAAGTANNYQHAGFIVDRTVIGTGSYALIMLQISP